jgi:hypothetical protein
MQLKRVAAVGAAAVGIAAVPGLASASSHIGFTLHAKFKCSSLPTCPKFTSHGSGGGFKVVVTGTVGGQNASGCALQKEKWTMKSAKGNLYLKSTYDKVCRASGSATKYIETGKLAVTGGSGKYKGAKGTATVKFTEYLQPPTVSGPVSITLTKL